MQFGRIHGMGKNTEGSILIVVLTTFVTFAGLQSCLAASETGRLAIVHLKDIKPYRNLSDGIIRRLAGKLQIKTFELDNKVSNKEVSRALRNFNPDVIACLGHIAHEFCDGLDIAPIVLAYDTKLLAKQNPFCVLEYLQPRAKTVVAVVDKGVTDRQGDFLVALAGRYDLRLSVKKVKPPSWEELLSGKDAILLGQGALVIDIGSKNVFFRNESVIAVVDRSIAAYRRLAQQCLRELPKIDEVIDLSNARSDAELRQKLKKSKPATIVCIGANSYQRCKFMQRNCRILIALKTEPVKNLSKESNVLSGVNMFTEPREQLQALSSLVKGPLKLVIPYNPENTELVVLKALLDARDIELVALPISNSRDASKALTKAFRNYDGVWVISDRTISVTPVQRFALEESLRRKKILVAMMHPYTRGGAAMAVSSVGKNDNALCDTMVELINEYLHQPNTAGRVASPPVSISLNVRTIKKLNYKVPQSLLKRADFVFGKE